MLASLIESALAAWPPDTGPPLVAYRAPGRVNIIGEHVDYNGLPVLPFAIDRNIVVLAAPHPDRLRLFNTAPDFPSREFDAGALPPREPTGDWTDLALRILAGIRKECAGSGLALGGMTCVIASDLPAAAGVSSSGALAVALTLACLGSHGKDALADRGRRRCLAQHIAAWERGRGTATGAMDQSICLLGLRGHALRIEWNPLCETPIPLPDGYNWIVAHSLVRADKGGAARAGYNQRVSETAMAALHLARLAFTDAPAADLRPPAVYQALLARLRSDDDPLSVEEVLAALPPDAPVLARRVRHLLTEALRVDEACEMLRGHEVEGLGYLLDGSHGSLRDDYGVSTPEVDRLVERLREAGALGARVVGAGFGGSVIAVAPAARTPSIIDSVIANYYERDLRTLQPELAPGSAPEARSAVLVVNAAAGAEAIHL